MFFFSKTVSQNTHFFNIPARLLILPVGLLILPVRQLLIFFCKLLLDAPLNLLGIQCNTQQSPLHFFLYKSIKHLITLNKHKKDEYLLKQMNYKKKGLIYEHV